MSLEYEIANQVLASSDTNIYRIKLDSDLAQSLSFVKVGTTLPPAPPLPPSLPPTLSVPVSMSVISMCVCVYIYIYIYIYIYMNI